MVAMRAHYPRRVSPSCPSRARLFAPSIFQLQRKPRLHNAMGSAPWALADRGYHRVNFVNSLAAISGRRCP